jgi:hypothetical protein
VSEKHAPLLGSLISEAHPVRDAVHVAVYPATAGEPLVPGQRVRFAHGLAWAVPATLDADTGNLHYSEVVHGIVDPFLPLHERVLTGQRFWLCLLPGSVTSLAHLWSAPGFPDRRLP